MIRPTDLLSIGINSLIKRKLRTFLTLTGVVIGTSAIIVLVSLSNGMDESFKQNIESMGSINNIEVFAPFDGMGMGMGSNSAVGKNSILNDKTIKDFENIEHVEAVLPIKETYMKLVIGKMVKDTSLIGTDFSKFDLFGASILKGSMPSGPNTLLFGFSTDKSFMNPRDRNNMDRMYFEESPPGETPEYDPKLELLTPKIIATSDYEYPENRTTDPDQKKPKKFKCKGVGILNYTGNWMLDEGVFIQLKSLKQMIKDDAKIMENRDALKRIDSYDRVYIRVDDIENVSSVSKKIKELGFEAQSPMDIINSMKEQSMQMRLFLGGIGAVSLLVAAVGIANTMVMSIYERTREIGVMKVIGAELDDIRNIFLMESGMIGLTGGLLGVLFSYGASWAINFVGQQGGDGYSMLSMFSMSIIDFKLALFGVTFATTIGLISGYSPARRAMKLSVLNALRNNA